MLGYRLFQCRVCRVCRVFLIVLKLIGCSKIQKRIGKPYTTLHPTCCTKGDSLIFHSITYFQTISTLPLSNAHTGHIFSSAVRIAFSTESESNPSPVREYASSILVSKVG